MHHAKDGDIVKVHYIGKFSDGTIFDSSADSEPLEFTLGQGEIIQGFEDAVIGMNPGDTKRFNVTPEKGYGPRRQEMVLQVHREKLPPGLDPSVGQQLQVHQADAVFPVTITDVSEAIVTLDGNHPLAGKELVFEIELVDIV